MMQRANISKSIISITSPGTHIVPGDTALGRSLTRKCNEYAADIKKRRPHQFGFWASLPLPDIEGSIAEIEYAFDTLNADGIVLQTNFHGVYLGDSKLDPVFEALNRRHAKIFIHPAEPCSCLGDTLQRTAPLPQYPGPMFEYLFDTTRAFINMFVSGTVNRYPNLTYILSHAGGAIPALVNRFTKFAVAILGSSDDMNVDFVKRMLQSRFYFDLAGFTFPEQIQGLLPYVDASRLTYGSDYPYTPEPIVLQLIKTMDQHLPTSFASEEDQIAIHKNNALEFLHN